MDKLAYINEAKEEFYKKFGYGYKNGVKELDEEHHYRLEKYR